jgi:uncharacterized membrane protein
MKRNYALILSLMFTGLLAGAFFYGTGNVIPAMYNVPINVHLMYRVQLMDHNAIYIQSLTAVAIITPIWLAVISKQHRTMRIFALLGSLAALTSILITRIGTVPINHMMRVWNSTGAPANWPEILHHWDVLNYVRTGFAILSFVLIIIASQSGMHEKTAIQYSLA